MLPAELLSIMFSSGLKNRDCYNIFCHLLRVLCKLYNRLLPPVKETTFSYYDVELFVKK